MRYRTRCALTAAMLALLVCGVDAAPHIEGPFLPLGHPRGEISSLSFSPDGAHLLTSGNGVIKVWNASQGVPLRTLSGEGWTLGWQGNTHALLVRDTTVSRWDISAGTTDPILDCAPGRDAKITTWTSSPDGRYLATVSTPTGDGTHGHTITVWDLVAGSQLSQLTPNVPAAEIVGSIIFSPATRYVALVSALHPDGRAGYNPPSSTILRVWDVARGLMQWETSENGYLRDVQFAAHGSKVMALAWPFRPPTSTDEEAPWREPEADARDVAPRMWATATGRIVRVTPRIVRGATAATFSDDGKQLITAHGNMWVRTHALGSGDELQRLTIPQTPNPFGRKSFPSWVSELTVSTHGRYVLGVETYPAYAGAPGGSAVTWDRHTGQVVSTYHSTTGPKVGNRSWLMSPDGKRFGYIARSGYAALWNITTGAETRTLRWYGLHKFGYKELTQDGRHLLVHDEVTTSVWHLDGTRTGRSWRRRGQWRTATLSEDGRYAVSGSGEGVISVWDTDTEAMVREYHGGRLASFRRSLAISPDNRYVAAEHVPPSNPPRRSVVRIWDTADGAEVTGVAPHGSLTSPMIFSQDGRRLTTVSHDASANDGSVVEVWDLRSGRKARLQSRHQLPTDTRWLARSLTGLLAVGMSTSVQIWNPSAGHIVQTMEEAKRATSAAFSPDGHSILTSSGRIYSVATGKVTADFGVAGDGWGKRVVAFNSDGSRVVMSGTEPWVTVWDVASSQLLVRRHSLKSGDWCAVTPDGRFDGSPGALADMYFVRGLEVLPLRSVPGRRRTPGLMRDILQGR